MSEDIGLGGGVGKGKSVVALSIVGKVSPECREELLAYLKLWARRCGARITSATVTSKKKRKKKKK